MKVKFLLAAMIACSGTVAAQNNLPSKNADTSVNEIALNEVTVATTRFATSKQYQPQQSLLLHSDKIKFYNQPTTAELLTHSGNVQVQKSQLGGGSPMLRGFEANKVLLVVDGVRMNNAIYRGGHLQNVITVDQNMLESAEVLFGPSSVMYGSDALGGVVSFYTRKPVYSTTAGKTMLSGNALLRYASASNEKSGHVDLNVGGKNIASLTSFTFSDFGDLRQGGSYFNKYPNWGQRSFYVDRINGVDSMLQNNAVNNQVKSGGYRQYDLLQKIAFNTGRTTHTINLQLSTSSNINRYDRLTETNGSGVAKSAEWYYGPQQRLMAAWHVHLAKSSWYDQAQITTAYQQIEESRHNRNFRSDKLNHRVERLNIVSVNADFVKKVQPFEWRYGAEVTYNYLSSTAQAENIKTGVISSLDTRYPDGGSNTQSYAAYTGVTYTINPKLIATAGLRFSNSRLFSAFNDKTFFPLPYNTITQHSNALTGNAGLVFLPGAGWKIAALVATGFRTPNIDDMSKVFESGGGTLIVPNPNLKPEKTINYELSISKTIPQKLQVSVTAWYTNYHDALGTDFSTFNGSPQIQYDGELSRVVTVVNKNSAYLYGINGSIEAMLGQHISFTSAINYTYGRINETPTDYPLDHVAPLFGKCGIRGKFGKWNGELFTLFNGAKTAANYNLRGEDNQLYSADVVNGFTPAWATINLRASYQIVSAASIQLAIENIADQYYRSFASGIGAAGRNVVVTLRAQL